MGPEDPGFEPAVQGRDGSGPGAGRGSGRRARQGIDMGEAPLISSASLDAITRPEMASMGLISPCRGEGRSRSRIRGGLSAAAPVRALRPERRRFRGN